jgi:hypothetical protein
MSKNISLLLLSALAFAVVSALALGVNISGSAGIGYLVGSALTTVGIAIIVSLIPAGIYWLIKRKRMPGLNITIWVLWVLIAVLSLVGNLM